MLHYDSGGDISGCRLLTSPWMRGMAPMAFCSALISAEGPVIMDVPVSTMASQPPLHRDSWLPTSMLDTHREVSAGLTNCSSGDGGISPVHVDLPVGLAGDVDIEEVAGVIFGVGSSEQQLAAGLRIRIPDARDSLTVSVGQSE